MMPEELMSAALATPSGAAAGSGAALVESPGNLSAEVDFAYLDFCVRRERGEAIDADQFCAEHPGLQSRLGRLLKLHLNLEANPEQLDEPRLPEVGETFFDFELVQELGHGAFARVFLAREPKMGGRLVALKATWNGAHEAERIGPLQHANIVQAHSVKTDEATGLTGICMPYLGNTTLSDVIAKLPARPSAANAIQDVLRERTKLDSLDALPKPGPVSPHATHADAVRAIGAQVADALAHLQAKGINHRDLKPSNILLTPAGVPVLLDFNLSSNAHTAAIVAGTMPYMAPEQIQHAVTETEVKTDPRSEVYALGVVLFELATGTHPFGPIRDDMSMLALRDQLLERQRVSVPDVRAQNPAIERSLSQLIARCLAYDPQARPPAAEVAAELRRQLRPAAKVRRFVARHPRLVFAALSVLMFAALATLAFAVTRPPRSVSAYEAGVQLFRQGAYLEAVDRFTASLEADPTNADTFFARGQAFQRLGALDEQHRQYLQPALTDFITADRLASSARTKAAIGYCVNLSEGDPQMAMDVYAQAIERGGESAAIHNNIAFCQLKKQKNDDAERSLDRALDLDDRLQPAYHNRGIVQRRKVRMLQEQIPGPIRNQQLANRIKAGTSDFAKAIALGPRTGDLFCDAARLAALAVKIDPDQKDAAFAFLKLGIRSGLTRQQFQTDVSFSSLKRDRRFQTILDEAPLTSHAPRATRIVNPVAWP